MPETSAARPAHYAAILICCVFVTTVAIWVLLRSTPSDAQVADNAQDAARYLRTRPFDPSGWLAWTGAGLAARARPAARDLAVAAAVRRLAPNDPQVLRADAHLAFRSGNVAAGLEQTAEVATLFPLESDQAYALLVRHLDHPAWPDFIARQTAKRWGGLSGLVQYACRTGTSLPHLGKLASQIFAKQPLSDENVTCIGERAIGLGDMATARSIWLNGSQRLPRTIANVFNGDFELPSGGRLFDWRIGIGGEYREGFAATIRTDASSAVRGNHVLSVRFNRRPIRTAVAQQYLALEPGAYSLQYRMRGGTQPSAQLGWSLSCLAKTAVIPLQLQTGADVMGDGWVSLRADFAVPEACAGQTLELAVQDRLQTLRGIQGEVAFDDISIVRR